MSRIINVLHLSDLHYSRRDGHNINVVLDALLKDLASAKNGSLKPDFVIFSGDLVQAADDPDIFCISMTIS